MKLVASLAVLLQIVLSYQENFDEFVREINETINEFSHYVHPVDNDRFFEPSSQKNEPIDFGTYDFVIAGGGTAGGVLANRLTEENYTVLLLEAGKWDPAIAKVLGLIPYLYQSNYNWGYNTVTQRNSCLGFMDNRCDYPRGQGLGGSSIINAGMYVRGNRKDYDDWAALGNTGWSYEEVLPYFIKSERADVRGLIDRQYHGFDGVQPINIPPDTPNYTAPVMEAFKESGQAEVDYNGQIQDGVGRMQFYLDYNVRSSTSHSYIRPASDRPNLFIQLESLVTKVLLSSPDRVAYGVQFVHKGQTYNATARKEVIVSAGSINSPQLLMLSGIGPAAHLEALGIDVVADLPVGQHLQDHLMYPFVHYRAKHALYDTGDDLRANLERWWHARRPLVGAVDCQMVSFYKFPDREEDRPDVELFVGSAFKTLPDISPENGEVLSQTINATTDFAIVVILLHPKSVGRVTLRSKDPRDFPLIDPNYFDDEHDLEMMYEGVRKVVALNDTKAFRDHGFRVMIVDLPACSRYERMSREWWYCNLRTLATTVFHPVGTTRMGISPHDSVVDNELKVHGVRKLRVVDAGVIPAHISGHTNAPVVMLAEKIADAIKIESLYT